MIHLDSTYDKWENFNSIYSELHLDIYPEILGGLPLLSKITKITHFSVTRRAKTFEFNTSILLEKTLKARPRHLKFALTFTFFCFLFTYLFICLFIYYYHYYFFGGWGARVWPLILHPQFTPKDNRMETCSQFEKYSHKSPNLEIPKSV